MPNTYVIKRVLTDMLGKEFSKYSLRVYGLLKHLLDLGDLAQLAFLRISLKDLYRGRGIRRSMLRIWS